MHSGQALCFVNSSQFGGPHSAAFIPCGSAERGWSGGALGLVLFPLFLSLFGHGAPAFVPTVFRASFIPELLQI